MEESRSTNGKSKKPIILLAFVLIFLALVLVVIAFFKIYPSYSVNQATVTPNPTPTKIVLKNKITGWLAAWDDSDAPMLLPYAINYFDIFSPMLYRIMPDSSLGHHQITNREFILNQAREKNIPIIPVITDESNYTSISRILNSENVQNDFINELIEEAETENYQGWAIDIEILKSTDEAKFSSFVKNASTKLHDNNLKLNMIVFGRVEKESYDPARAHNYKTIGRYADQVQLMTYNFNNEFTKPGGQTPIAWYRRVLKYASQNIPAEKILVGLSTHGYDWTGNNVNGLDYQDALDLLSENEATPSFNPSHSSKFANFTDSLGRKHSVWYEDAQTIKEKVDIAKNEFGINKFALWRLSAEDPAIWELLKN